MRFLVGLLFAFVIINSIQTFSIKSILKGPIHASCKIDWTWPSTDCKTIQTNLIAQINTWTTDDNCKNGGEKCLYKLVSSSSSQLQATHTTPVKQYVDDLTFKFVSSGSGCNVNGFSTSETWYAVLDYGTNYCNLNNLITGAGLDKLAGYQESTNDNVCTQHSSANCTIY